MNKPKERECSKLFRRSNYWHGVENSENHIIHWKAIKKKDNK